MRDGDMNCEGIQLAARQGQELKAYEAAHLDECDACMDVWLTAALDEKPEVAIPKDFAVRVAAQLPVRPPQRAVSRTPRHLGLAGAMAVVTVLLVACFAGPNTAHSWVGVVFVMVVATEIAGLALWLGPKRMRL
jgi:hypothetical protein